MQEIFFDTAEVFLNLFHSFSDIFFAVLSFLLIVILGFLLGKLVYILISRLLRLIRFDRLIGRLELTSLFSPTVATARFFYFATVIIFFLLASREIIPRPLNTLINDVYLAIGDTLLVIGIAALSLFAAHYIGSLLKLLTELTGLGIGVYIYNGFCSLMLLFAARLIIVDYLTVATPYSYLIVSVLFLAIPYFVIRREKFAGWLRGEEQSPF
ncbi:MAG: hypothetical protein ACLFN5_01965 [bacterium]